MNILCGQIKKQFQDSPVFQKYVDRIRIDFGLPDTVDDQVIFQMLAELETWTKKGSAVKQSRWFSWHDSAHDHLKEWWASRMIYEWYFCGRLKLIQLTILSSSLSSKHVSPLVASNWHSSA